MRKFTLIAWSLMVVALLVTISKLPKANADEVYLLGGLQHFSSPTTGVPIDHRRETSYDAAYVGIEYIIVPPRGTQGFLEGGSLGIRGEVMHIINPDNEVHGDNPFARISIEYRHRIFQ